MTLTSEQAVLANHRLLQALTEVQTAFTQGQPAPRLFDRLLGAALELTGSEYGFIGEVVPTSEGAPTLKPHAFQNSAWTLEARGRPASEGSRSLTFGHLQSLFNDVLASGQPVVSPAPATETDSGSPPEGPAALRSFLGLPLQSRDGVVGLVGLANGRGGYDDALVTLLQPIQATCCSLLMGLRNEQRRRQAEEELRQAQERLLATERMASLGTLTAGVAHEINNPLAYMLSNLNYVSEELHTLVKSDGRLTGARARDILDALEETLSGSTRLRDIVRDLKLFSRAQLDQQEPTELHALLDSCVNVVWGEIKHRARLVKDYGDVPLVHGNESRLAQVFLNLLINAVQALPHEAHESSEIRITTRHEEGLVMVAVRDTGVGIPEEHLPRLFEPFFTTKPVGEGTGLGLSISQGIVTAMGGRITVESRPGQGSTFRVFLPVGGHLPIQGRAV
jgi:signal transduction histidine kinase